MKKLKVLDLFSGIGGFSLGLERTGGFETVAFCEIDPFCQKVLKKHWPDVPIYNDVRKLEDEYASPPPDLICGGYPCQGESIAGHLRGEKDDRWLWPSMFSVLKKFGQAWLVGENVANHARMGLDTVLSDLESIGYAYRSFDIYSCAADLPSMERHIWTVAAPDGVRLEGCWEEKIQKFAGISGQFPRSYSGGIDRWNLPAARVCGVGEGIPDRLHRLKSLGNAVDPFIPEILGHAILAAEGRA